MNIHRKDRAKLKEFSDENFLSLDIAKSVDSAGDEGIPKEATSAAAASDDESRDLLFLRSKHDNSVRSLKLFAVSGDLDERKMELINGGVDLELRLGLHPHHEPKIKLY